MEVAEIVKTLYQNFNDRNIDQIFLVLHKDVKWANGWEGGFVHGHDEVRDYWTRQWKEIIPFVYPVSIKDHGECKIEVEVHQIVNDMKGNLIVDGIVNHHFQMESGLITEFGIGK
ncbi:MAG TPA: nuclear transport factor 2 family protein [Flavitalea sp.]|nr:nuclear transport factor 2 family protein [Flavitalea sp.]